jgi:outer membrane protein assembly factor BamB
VVYGYTGSGSPKLQAVSAADGTPLFEIADPNFSWDGWSMNVALALGSQQDALATHNGRLISFDLANHQIRWEKTGGYAGQVTVTPDAIYVVAHGQVEARRESDGSALWIWIPPEGAAIGQLVATDNLLLVSTDANTYAIDITSHRQVWSYPAGGSLAVSSDGTLFIARAEGKLTAIALK